MSLQATMSSSGSFTAAGFLRLYEFWKKCQHDGWWVHM